MKKSIIQASVAGIFAMSMSINDYINNPLFDTDSYKITHPWQYEEGMDGIVAYIEARGGADETMWAGMQTVIHETLTKQITADWVDEAEAFWTEHIGYFYRPGWDYVVNECNGYIPIDIYSAPEGLVIPTKNALAVVWCDDPVFAPCMQHLETLLLRPWYTSSVGTISYQAKEMILDGMLESCDTLDKLPWMLHDFGARGVSSPQSAALGGMAHLINFQGSDTGLGIIGARLWYDCHMAGYSIPASEHATITSWGLDTKGETAAFRNMIKAFGKSAIFACVSDGNDIEKATGEIWGTALYDEVMAMNATLVIRPDSGDPIEWLPKLLRILDAKFGSVKNSKGYKVLNKVRLIQGDGVTIKSLPLMIKAILDAGFSLDNVAFGMGGGLLQKVDRDTFKWAMKCCAIRINGEWKEVFKDPATDPGKKSKRGFPALYRNKETGEYKTLAGLQHEHPGVDWEGILQPIYRHSRILPQPMIHRIKFSEMRYNASLKLNL